MRHTDPPGAQCSDCPGDGERSWRHAFTPDKPLTLVSPEAIQEALDAAESGEILADPAVRESLEQLLRGEKKPATTAEEEGTPAEPFRDDLWGEIRSAIYEYRERTMLWEETGGITEGIADAARRAVQGHPEPPLTPEEEEGLAQVDVDTPGCDCGHDGMGEKWHAGDCAWRSSVKAAVAPGRPPVAVAYAVQGGALFEVLVPGDATVVATEGRLVITHARPVAGIVQIKPYGEESA